jgi:large subunit ribosomal protein LX
MKAYRVSGRFRMGRKWQTYAKEVAAADEASARERTLSVLGSQHGVLRKYIAIEAVVELPPSEVQDHAVRFRVEGRA